AEFVTLIEGAARQIGRHGTVPEQAAELIRWAESSTGPGLEAIRRALADLVTSRRTPPVRGSRRPELASGDDPPHPPFGHGLPGGEKGTVIASVERDERRGGDNQSLEDELGQAREAAKAEAHHAAYRAALERGSWDEALAELQQAIDADDRFAAWPR